MHLKKICRNNFILGFMLGAAATLGACALAISFTQKNSATSNSNSNSNSELASELFSDKDFRHLSETCREDEIQSSTSYGMWHTAKGCQLAATQNRPETPIDEILLSETGELLAARRLIINENRHRFFSSVLGTSVKQESFACSRYGSNGAPILTITKTKICDELIYNNI